MKADSIAPLQRMLLIRAFENRVDALFKKGVIGGTTHLSTGQEACAVGLCDTLEKADLVVSTHRGHGHYLAKGGSADKLMAELYGKAAGIGGGIGGSQHVADFSIGFMGSNGITGGGLPVATGIALAEKMKKSGLVTVCFLGDGAVGQGTFHESLNLAAIWDLPIVFFCENNQYAMSTPFARTSPVARVADRAAAYNLPGLTIDGNDYTAVKETMQKVLKETRQGRPALVEALTYRHHGHSKSDQCEYRTAEEEQAWLDKDPIKRYTAFLLAEGTEQKVVDKAVQDAETLIDKAVAFAEQAPFPS